MADRMLGVTYFAFLAVMMALKGKDYYVAPIYPMLFPVGGAFWERAKAIRWLRWVGVALQATVVVAGIISAPIVLPILPPEKVLPYFTPLGVGIPRTETGMKSLSPQYFADEFGWPEMVEKVAGVYHSLPPDQRTKTAIPAGNCSEAGAIDSLGPRYGLPKAISAHQNYYYWGATAIQRRERDLAGVEFERRAVLVPQRRTGTA
jgi:hypothetical protein